MKPEARKSRFGKDRSQDPWTDERQLSKIRFGANSSSVVTLSALNFREHWDDGVNRTQNLSRGLRGGLNAHRG